MSGQRLNTLILLVALAYTSALIQGEKIKQMGVQKYICRVKEPKRIQRRHSIFYIGGCVAKTERGDRVESSYPFLSFVHDQVQRIRVASL